MPKRFSRRPYVMLLVLVAAVSLAVLEVAWLGERVTQHRARHAAMADRPAKASLHLSLPLTGFKP
jgi:hypothetical protein